MNLYMENVRYFYFLHLLLELFFVNCHLVKSLRREIDNAGGDGCDLEDLDDGDVRHSVDCVEQDQVECVDDGGTGEGNLASNNDKFTESSSDRESA